MKKKDEKTGWGEPEDVKNVGEKRLWSETGECSERIGNSSGSLASIKRIKMAAGSLRG